MPIKVYTTNITANQSIIGNQRKLKHILETNKILFVEIDISEATNAEEKQFLQNILTSEKRKFVLPQIFNDEQRCCDFDEFIEAVESENLRAVLKLDKQIESSDSSNFSTHEEQWKIRFSPLLFLFSSAHNDFENFLSMPI